VSIIVDDIDSRLAARIAQERARRQWSLADLADRSGVSKAMLSRIERGEASPTAALLVRIASAFGLTFAGLLDEAPQRARLLREADQPRWRDPATGYVRRQVFQNASVPVELVEVELPPGERAAFPASSYENLRHVVWLLRGELEIREGDEVQKLSAGDRLEFGPPQDTEYRNPGKIPNRYLVVLVRA